MIPSNLPPQQPPRRPLPRKWKERFVEILEAMAICGRDVLNTMTLVSRAKVGHRW